MHFQAKSKDDEELYRCAKFCYQSAEPLLASLPRTREAQAILVNFLRTQIVESGQGFSIGVDFLIERMGCTDANLVGKWSDAPADFAWLMVHPQFSNYFARFVIDNWNPQLYVIHHVPKSAGTSLYELINDQSYFIAYPQINFDAMCKTNGLLGFAHQLARFESRQISQ